MDENLPDTNVGNIEYISKQDAVERMVDVIINEFDVGITYAYTLAEDGLSLPPAADVITKADMITLLEETEKEVLKGINRYSAHWVMIDSIFGIIKCKVNMMGENNE